MNAYLVIGLVGLAIVAAVFVWSAVHINKTPAVKPIDAIDEEVRRERIELHNTSLHYAELQRAWIQDHTPTPLTANRLEGLLATAFREGAKWQQRRP